VTHEAAASPPRSCSLLPFDCLPLIPLPRGVPACREDVDDGDARLLTDSELSKCPFSRKHRRDTPVSPLSRIISLRDTDKRVSRGRVPTNTYRNHPSVTLPPFSIARVYSTRTCLTYLHGIFSRRPLAGERGGRVFRSIGAALFEPLRNDVEKISPEDRLSARIRAIVPRFSLKTRTELRDEKMIFPRKIALTLE